MLLRLLIVALPSICFLVGKKISLMGKKISLMRKKVSLMGKKVSLMGKKVSLIELYDPMVAELLLHLLASLFCLGGHPINTVHNVHNVWSTIH